MIKNIIYLIFLLTLADNAMAIHFGVGYTSLTSGRPVPGVNFGLNFWNDYTVSGMAAGVATKAYHSSSYNLNILKYGQWSSSRVGEIKMGIGLGFHYNKKGIISQFADESQNKKEETQTDEDIMGGPAFRVSIIPGGRVMACFEYVFGVGGGLLLNGWGDEGIFAIGVEI